MTQQIDLEAERERLAALRKPVERCDAEARRGTGTGACNAPLDEHGQCPSAGSHV